MEPLGTHSLLEARNEEWSEIPTIPSQVVAGAIAFGGYYVRSR
ncbi:hypothetical protein ACF3DV_10630 [Chlorogloeopsis fritschii PCC 9212]|nr:hypothetical protein [Chlorogloeopsis fritschii]